MKIPFKYFEAIEIRTWLLGILTAAFLSLGGLAEITPLFAAANSVKAPEGVKPYSAERLAGFEVYVHNGCYLCHSQMIRQDRKSTRLNSSHVRISYAVFCLKKKI